MQIPGRQASRQADSPHIDSKTRPPLTHWRGESKRGASRPNPNWKPAPRHRPSLLRAVNGVERRKPRSKCTRGLRDGVMADKVHVPQQVARLREGSIGTWAGPCGAALERPGRANSPGLPTMSRGRRTKSDPTTKGVRVQYAVCDEPVTEPNSLGTVTVATMDVCTSMEVLVGRQLGLQLARTSRLGEEKTEHCRRLDINSITLTLGWPFAMGC